MAKRGAPKYPKTFKKKLYKGEIKEFDSQILKWRRARRKSKEDSLAEALMHRKTRRQRINRVRRSLKAARTPTIDFFGSQATTPVPDTYSSFIGHSKKK